MDLQAAAHLTVGQVQEMQNALAQANQRIQQLRERPRPAVLKPRTFGNSTDEDWVNYRRHFEDVVAANGWNAEIACLALSASMVGAAASAVHDIHYNAQAPDVTPLLNDYEARFLPASASQMARVRFDNACQGAKETLLSWHARLRTLYRRAYPNGNDTPLIRRFTLGLRNSTLREQVLRQQPADYNAALNAAQNEQSIVEVTTALHLGPGEEPMEIGALADMACHFCEKKGHIRRDCRAFQRAREQLGLAAKPPRAEKKKNSKKPAAKAASSSPKKQWSRKYRRKLIALLGADLEDNEDPSSDSDEDDEEDSAEEVDAKNEEGEENLPTGKDF